MFKLLRKSAIAVFLLLWSTAAHAAAPTLPPQVKGWEVTQDEFATHPKEFPGQYLTISGNVVTLSAGGSYTLAYIGPYPAEPAVAQGPGQVFKVVKAQALPGLPADTMAPCGDPVTWIVLVPGPSPYGPSLSFELFVSTAAPNGGPLDAYCNYFTYAEPSAPQQP
jgi:hypothetical protein